MCAQGCNGPSMYVHLCMCLHVHVCIDHVCAQGCSGPSMAHAGPALVLLWRCMLLGSLVAPEDEHLLLAPCQATELHGSNGMVMADTAV